MKCSLGRDWTRPEHDYSASTGQAIDQQVQQIARQALDHAVQLLEPRRQLMDELVTKPDRDGIPQWR